jgi:hypothetical protein
MIEDLNAPIDLYNILIDFNDRLALVETVVQNNIDTREEMLSVLTDWIDKNKEGIL